MVKAVGGRRPGFRSALSRVASLDGTSSAGTCRHHLRCPLCTGDNPLQVHHRACDAEARAALVELQGVCRSGAWALATTNVESTRCYLLPASMHGIRITRTRSMSK